MKNISLDENVLIELTGKIRKYLVEKLFENVGNIPETHYLGVKISRIMNNAGYVIEVKLLHITHYDVIETIIKSMRELADLGYATIKCVNGRLHVDFPLPEQTLLNIYEKLAKYR